MNLGQHISDLIRLSAEIQKVSADTKNVDRLYRLSLEAKMAVIEIQAFAKSQMLKKEQND